jgi:hypothetical protein
MAKKDVFAPVDTDHPAFRSWFGESVLHDDGVPRTYYHGTSKDTDFKKFKMSRHGIWMTTEPKEASQYALENDSQGFKRDGWDLKRSNTASRVIPVHARIEKPFVGLMPQEYMQDNYKKSQSDWFDALRSNGYDGWVPESQNGKLAVALGHPGQIKSALSNSGEYSETGDINKADGGAVDDEDEGLTAYHGSPYDFEQFDTSKIGTGEGAQAYGHGLYFAESEPVAKEYRDKLTAGTYKGDTGKVFDPFDDLEHMNVRVAAYKSIDNAIDRAKGLLEDYPNSDAIKRDLAKLMEAKAQNAQPQTGRMYEVRINAHPDHFLDWDTPLNEQSEHVQSAIKSIANSVDVDPFEHLALAASIGKHPRSQDYSPRGNDLYNDLEEIIGDKTKVSDLLHQNGLKGIRYLDAGSRKDTDQPTRNYVVFNHDHVQVKRKYAQGGAIDET